MEEKGLRIFIAEDEPIVLMGFRAMVSECGHTVVGTAADGQAAIDGVLETKPDVVIMDINMPVVDGITAVEKINETLPVPAIVVTGYRSENYVERASSAEVYGYLQKPVDEYELRSALKIAARQFRKKQQAEEERQEAVRKLEERKVIERAKGVLMDKLGLSEQQAMKALQKKSADSNKKLYDAAREILEVGEKLL